METYPPLEPRHVSDSEEPGLRADPTFPNLFPEGAGFDINKLTPSTFSVSPRKSPSDHPFFELTGFVALQRLDRVLMAYRSHRCLLLDWTSWLFTWLSAGSWLCTSPCLRRTLAVNAEADLAA